MGLRAWEREANNAKSNITEAQSAAWKAALEEVENNA
jgi:hypothetical protein